MGVVDDQHFVVGEVEGHHPRHQAIDDIGLVEKGDDYGDNGIVVAPAVVAGFPPTEQRHRGEEVEPRRVDGERWYGYQEEHLAQHH
jgi:hypothetical protein